MAILLSVITCGLNYLSIQLIFKANFQIQNNNEVICLAYRDLGPDYSQS